MNSFKKKSGQSTQIKKEQELEKELTNDQKQEQEFDRNDKDEEMRRKNIFFGHGHIDGILENKLRAGTIISMEEDKRSKLGNYLIRYFIGSGFHSKQDVIVYEDDYNDHINYVPIIQRQTNLKQNNNSNNNDNKIAWRYNNMNLSQQNVIPINPNIPKLDMSRNVEDQNALKSQIFIQKSKQFHSLDSLFQDLMNTYQQQLKDYEDNSFFKIVLEDLFEISNDQHKIFFFLNNLRIFIKSCFAICLVVVPHNLQAQFKQILIMQSDIFMKVESQLENQVFQEFQGLLHFQKVPLYTSFDNFQLSMLTWGIQIPNKKQIDVCKLYLSPEKEEQQQIQDQEQQKTSNKKQNQGLLCGTKVKLNNIYDF